MHRLRAEDLSAEATRGNTMPTATSGSPALTSRFPRSRPIGHDPRCRLPDRPR
jgi:hypothetical protein